MPSTPSADRDAAIRVALRLLSIRARSRQEVVERLRRRGFPSVVVAQVVQDLMARGLVDDQAFALQRARTRVLNRHLSPRWLKRELRDTGVAEEIVEATVRHVFQEIEEEEVARAGAVKRLKALGDPSSAAVQRRLAAYLLRRGFSPETARRVITSLAKDAD